jgi:hypothetical protein
MIFISFRRPAIKRARVHARAQRLAQRTLGRKKLPPEQLRAEINRLIPRLQGTEIARAALAASGITGTAKRRRIIKAVEAFANAIDPLIPRVKEPGVVERLDALDAQFKQEVFRALEPGEAEKFLKNYFDIEVE